MASEDRSERTSFILAGITIITTSVVILWGVCDFGATLYDVVYKIDKKLAIKTFAILLVIAAAIIILFVLLIIWGIRWLTGRKSLKEKKEQDSLEHDCIWMTGKLFGEACQLLRHCNGLLMLIGLIEWEINFGDSASAPEQHREDLRERAKSIDSHPLFVKTSTVEILVPEYEILVNMRNLVEDIKENFLNAVFAPLNSGLNDEMAIKQASQGVGPLKEMVRGLREQLEQVIKTNQRPTLNIIMQP